MATKSKQTKGSKKRRAEAATLKPAAKNGEPKLAAKPVGGSKAKSVHAKPTENKHVSALDAAASVLQKFGKPMRSRELINAMSEKGLWSSPRGKTPWATLYSSMIREISTAGRASRFKKVDRGAFTFNR